MIRSQDELIPDICVFFKETWDNVMCHMVCYSEPSGKKVLLEARHFQKKYLGGDWMNDLSLVVSCKLTSTNQVNGSATSSGESNSYQRQN